MFLRIIKYLCVYALTYFNRFYNDLQDTRKGWGMEKTVKKRIGNDLTDERYIKTLIVFSVPILFSNIIQILYTTIDLIILGQSSGSVGNVGISAGGELVVLITRIAASFATAGQIYLSQLAGAQDAGKIKKAIGSFWTGAAIFSVITAAVTIIVAKPFLAMINTPSEAFSEAAVYMAITALGIPFIFMYNAASGTLHSMGQSRAPLLFVTIAGIVNIFLDLLLINVFHMGAAGAAIATVTGQILSCTASMLYIYWKRELYGFDFRLGSWKMERETTGILVRIIIPQAGQTMLLHGAQIYCSSQINIYGLTASAANSIGTKINQMGSIFRSAICSATSAMVGQYLGAKKYESVKKVVGSALAFTTAFAMVNITLCLLFPRQIFGIFNSDPAVMDYGIIYMRIVVIYFIISAVMGPLNSVVLASGAVKLEFLVGILDGVIFRIGISLLLSRGFHMGVVGFFWGNSLCIIVPLVLDLWYYFSKRWTKPRLIKGE